MLEDGNVDDWFRLEMVDVVYELVVVVLKDLVDEILLVKMFILVIVEDIEEGLGEVGGVVVIKDIVEVVGILFVGVVVVVDVVGVVGVLLVELIVEDVVEVVGVFVVVVVVVEVMLWEVG